MRSFNLHKYHASVLTLHLNAMCIVIKCDIQCINSQTSERIQMRLLHIASASNEGSGGSVHTGAFAARKHKEYM